MSLYGRRVVAVIPALNESASIGKVIADLPSTVDHVIVADNGSTDDTAAVASAHGAIVVSQPERGYGAACLAALDHAATLTPDVVLFIDGDYSDDPREATSVLDRVCSGEADVCIGSRVLGEREPGSLTPQQRFGNWLSTRLIRWFFGTSFTDLGPFRAITWSALQSLHMTDRNYGWTVEMQIKAAVQHLRCIEVPVSYRRRIGTSKVSGTVKGSVMAGTIILSTIAKAALQQRRLRQILATVFAVGFVIAAFQHHGVLSDDALRYHWDGWIGAHGVDPYANVPDHETLAPYHVTVDGVAYPTDVPYAHLPTVYPPGAQLLFTSIAWMVGIDPLMWKLIWSVLLLSLLFLVHRQLAENERIWLWIAVSSPFYLVHAVADLHLDALMSACTLLALLAYRRSSVVESGVWLAVAVSLKYAPLVALPFLLMSLTWRQRLMFIAAFATVLGVIALPYVGSPLWGDLQNFITNWKANAAVYDVARALLPDRTQTRLLLTAVVLIVIGVAWRRWKHQPLTMIAMTMVIILICSPVIHAWYLLTPLMLLPLVPLRSVIVWSVTMAVYAVFVLNYRATGKWEEPPVLLALEALPVLVAYVFDVRRGPITAS